MRGYPKFKWNKFGKLLIYEGDNYIIVGKVAKGYGYAVMEKGCASDLDKSGKIVTRHHGYFGYYETRKEALDLFNHLERGAKKGGLSLFSISGDKEMVEHGGWSSRDAKSGFTVLVFPEERPEDLVHEYIHHMKGHLKKRPYRRVEKEKEVLKAEIEEFSKIGKYTPERRKMMAKHLATYLEGSKRKRLKEARKIIKKLESEADTSGPSRLPDFILEHLDG